ncbi:hypothetical protein RQ831_21915 [Roseomonas gilardii]|uniref:MarR family transcriptional regulator n=1 Tax=Roseomonas gilardii TaxID=257708 RepID=A0ABU3MMS7_9PROT|nr:hypothetical protein [Roseomonas gilardii]MDT8333716.1 hypothetical protein [Roseomonas gilardii]
MSSEANLRHAILGGAFTYTARPEPMPGDLRMSWGIAVLLLGLFYSRAKKSNFLKLQFMAHAVRLPEGREEVRGLLSGAYKPTEVSVRVEPSLNRAVALAHALKLVKIEKGTSVSLTDTGEKIATTIVKDDETLRTEVSFLREIAPKMTDALMKRIWRLEDLL